MRKDFEEALKRGMREFGQIIKKTHGEYRMVLE